MAWFFFPVSSQGEIRRGEGAGIDGLIRRGNVGAGRRQNLRPPDDSLERGRIAPSLEQALEESCVRCPLGRHDGETLCLEGADELAQVRRPLVGYEAEDDHGRTLGLLCEPGGESHVEPPFEW